MTSAALSLQVDLTSLFGELDGMTAECEAAARPAAQAGAQVLYEEVQRNVATRTRRKTGNLASSIYQVYSKSSSRPGFPVYHISWNYKKAPHGHLVEYGHLQRFEISFDPVTKRFTTHRDRPLPQPKQVAARPFVRPAVSAFPRAEQAMLDRYLAELTARGVLQ